MTKTKSSRSKRSKAVPPTLLRAYRFNARTIGAFENDCARQLRNPKRVLEALIQHWLEADAKAQAAIAEQLRQHVANNNG